jgi:hypothetical protein
MGRFGGVHPTRPYYPPNPKIAISRHPGQVLGDGSLTRILPAPARLVDVRGENGRGMRNGRGTVERLDEMNGVKGDDDGERRSSRYSGLQRKNSL